MRIQLDIRHPQCSLLCPYHIPNTSVLLLLTIRPTTQEVDMSGLRNYDYRDCLERINQPIILIQTRKRRRKETCLEYRARSAASGSRRRSICLLISDYTMVSLDSFSKGCFRILCLSDHTMFPRSLVHFHTATYCSGAYSTAQM